MTDKEIIKALECCFSPYGCGDCPSPDKSCTDEDCAVSLSREAIALITCQKSQIEDLSVALYERLQRIKELEAEVERLEKLRAEASKEVERQYEQAEADILGNMADGGTICHWCINKHRTAAIKEFAERLKEKDFYWKDDRLCSTKWVAERIDTLVKEMTEDTDNE